MSKSNLKLQRSDLFVEKKSHPQPFPKGRELNNDVEIKFEAPEERPVCRKKNVIMKFA